MSMRYKEANRDWAEQLAEIRHLAKQFPIPSAALDEEASNDLPNAGSPDADVSGSDTENSSLALDQEEVWIDFCDPKQLWEQCERARKMSGESATVIQDALKKCTVHGHRRRVGQLPPMVALDEIERDFPHCLDVLIAIRKRIVLQQLAPHAPLHLPPMLLGGPPGTGKTAFSQRLADAMGVPIKFIDVSTLESPFSLVGLDAAYSTGRPGLIWEALQNTCASPVLVLDELDKAGTKLSESGMGFLLGLMEPSTARSFVDAALQLAIDASHIHWIATCNDLSKIEAPLLSRMRVYNIELPSREQMPAVISSVYRELQAREPWAKMFAPLSGEVVKELSRRTPREIRMSIEDACANAATNGRSELWVQDLPKAINTDEVARMGFL